MAERYTEISIEEMDNFLKEDKGWQKNISGYEYVYDYKMKHFPVLIKVMSSVSVVSAKGRNKGSDAIRVFAVQIDKNGKVIKGLLSSKRVYRTENWRENLEKAVYGKLKQAKKVCQERGIK